MQRPVMGEVISEAWDKYKKYLGILIGAYFVIWMLTSITQIPLNIASSLSNVFTTEDVSAGVAVVFFIILMGILIIFVPASMAVSTWLGIGERNILLAAADDKPIDFVDLFKPKGLFWRYLGASLLVGLIVFGGMLLFIIPGIYFAIRFSFVNNSIVDKRLTAMEALSYSSKLTLKNKWYLIGWGFLMFGINLLGVMALFIGLIFTIPFTALATMVLYRHLSNNVDQQTKTPTQKQATAAHTAQAAK